MKNLHTQELTAKYMITKQAGNMKTYYGIGSELYNEPATFSDDICNTSLFATMEQAAPHAAQHSASIEEMQCYPSALAISGDQSDSCSYLLYPDRNSEYLTRYILCRENSGKIKYYHINDSKWQPAALANDMRDDYTFVDQNTSGNCDSILETQLLGTHDDAMKAAEGQNWEVKHIVVGVLGFFQHGLNRQHFTMPLSVYAANDLNGHADDTASIAHFLIQRVDPEHGICFIRQGTFPERLYLLVEPFGHLTNLTAGQVLDAQTLGELIHLARGYPLHESFLYYLNQGCFTSLAFGYEEGDVARRF